MTLPALNASARVFSGTLHRRPHRNCVIHSMHSMHDDCTGSAAVRYSVAGPRVLHATSTKHPHAGARVSRDEGRADQTRASTCDLCDGIHETARPMRPSMRHSTPPNANSRNERRRARARTRARESMQNEHLQMSTKISPPFTRAK